MNSLNGNFLAISLLVKGRVNVSIGSTTNTPLQLISVIDCDETSFTLKLGFSWYFRLNLPDHLCIFQRLVLLLGLLFLLLICGLSWTSRLLCSRLFILFGILLLLIHILMVLLWNVVIRMTILILSFLVSTDIILELLCPCCFLLLHHWINGSTNLTCHTLCHLTIYHLISHVSWVHLSSIRHSIDSTCTHCPLVSESTVIAWIAMSWLWHKLISILWEHWHTTLMLLTSYLVA